MTLSIEADVVSFTSYQMLRNVRLEHKIINVFLYVLLQQEVCQFQHKVWHGVLGRVVFFHSIDYILPSTLFGVGE